MEMHNIDDFAKSMVYKSKAVALCSNSLGQIGVGLMVTSSFDVFRSILPDPAPPLTTLSSSTSKKNAQCCRASKSEPSYSQQS